ncbi:unnamed protein product, partial [Effrenium voratum]
ALACFHACGVEDQRELRAVHLVVNAQIARGEPWRAIWTAEDAVARYRHRKERRMEAQALLCVAKGYSHSPSGREQQEVPQDLQMKMKPPPEEAVAAMQQALQIARQLNDSVLEAQVMTALSSTHVKREEMEEAIFAAHDALSHREVKDTVGKGVAFQSLASAHLHNKDYDTAERAARAARDICRKEDLWQGDASGLLSMAEVLLAEDKLEESVETAKEAQGLYAEHKDRKGEAQSLLQVAKARLAGMHYEKALHAAERAHELFLRVNDQLGKCSALGVMAECRSQLLQRQQQQSTAKFSRGKRATGVKAPLPWEELSRAAKVSKEATEAAKRVGDLQAEASARCIMAQIHIFNGRPQSEILEALEEAMALAVEGGEPKIEGTALLLKAEVHLQAEELKDALNAARQAQLLLKDADTASKAKVEEILDRLRVHEFRVDEAPSARATYGGFDPRLAAMMPAMVSGPDPATVRATIQEVTRKMVGKEDDVEADMPLMDIGRAQPPSKSQHPVNVWLEKMAAMENRALMWQADLDQELRRLQAEVKAVAQLAEQVEQPDLEEKLSLFRFEVEKIRQFLVEVLQLLLDRKQKDQELQRREEALKLWEQRLEAAPKAKELERREAALNLWEQRLQRQEAAKPAAKTKPKQRVKEAAKEEPKAKRRAQYLTFEERRWAWLREAALQAAPQEDLPEEDEDELFLALTAPAPPAHKVNEQLEPVSSTAAPELESQAQETEDANPRSEELGEAASLSGQEKARAKKKDWYLRHFPGAVAPREAPIPRFERPPKGRGRGKAHPRGVSTRPPRPREEWAYRPLKRRCAAQFQGLLQDYLQLERLPRVDEVLPAL